MAQHIHPHNFYWTLWACNKSCIYSQYWIWAPSSIRLTSTYVMPLNTLARSNKLWTSIGINKLEQFQHQRHCKHILWPTTSIESSTSNCSWYCSYKRLLLMSAISCVDNAPKECGKAQQELKTLKAIHIPNQQKTKRWSLGWAHLRSAIMCVRLLFKLQQSTINHQHAPNLQDGESLHIHENFKELPQALNGNPLSQNKISKFVGSPSHM